MSASSRAEYPVNSDPPVNLLSVLDVADRPTAVNLLRFTGIVLIDRRCSIVACNVGDAGDF